MILFPAPQPISCTDWVFFCLSCSPLSSHTLAFSCHGACGNERVGHCLPFPLVILLNERSWMKTPGVLSSLCSHPAAAPLGCSVFSCKISHGICSSLPQRAGLELDLLLVELPYSLDLGSELGFQAEIGSQMVNPPPQQVGKAPWCLSRFSAFSLWWKYCCEAPISKLYKAHVFLQTWTYYRN